MSVIPVVGRGEKEAGDIVSKLMEQRVIFLNEDVNDHNTHLIVQQLMYLDSLNHDDIKLYISSPGGLVHAGLAVYDAMRLVKSDIQTIVLGLAASMGFFLTCVGTKGKRYAGRHAQLMAHEVSSGTRGRVSDQIVSLEHSKKLNQLLTRVIAESCGQDYDTIYQLLKEDQWMSAEEAKAFGAVDHVL